MIPAGRSLPDDHGDMISVGRLQPDMVLVSRILKKIGVLEICRPMDESSSQLQAATARKLRTYATLLTALKTYLDDGWQVKWMRQWFLVWVCFAILFKSIEEAGRWPSSLKGGVVCLLPTAGLQATASNPLEARPVVLLPALYRL